VARKGTKPASAVGVVGGRGSFGPAMGRNLVVRPLPALAGRWSAACNHHHPRGSARGQQAKAVNLECCVATALRPRGREAMPWPAAWGSSRMAAFCRPSASGAGGSVALEKRGARRQSAWRVVPACSSSWLLQAAQGNPGHHRAAACGNKPATQAGVAQDRRTWRRSKDALYRRPAPRGMKREVSGPDPLGFPRVSAACVGTTTRKPA